MGSGEGGLESFDFFYGEFAGEDGALHGEDGFEESETLRGSDGHLGGGVEFHVGDGFPGQFGEADVLDDEGVHAGLADEAEAGEGGIDFRGEHEGVHGDEAFDAVFVEVGEEFGEVGFGEIVRAEAGVEIGEAEVDGIRAGGDRGAGAVPVSGGGEEFGHGGDV